MSGADTPQGPGWWQASDAKWYPPEQASTSAVPAAPVPTPPSAGPGTTPPAGATEQAGFFSRLFDISLKSFITPSIIKVLFVLGIIVISIISAIMLIAGFASDDARPFILFAPLYWFFGILYLRVILEVIVVLFRIEENTRHQR